MKRSALLVAGRSAGNSNSGRPAAPLGTRDNRRSRRVPATWLTAGGMLTIVGAVLVTILGVIATSGVYGSWLLGVALPLLGLTMLLLWSATRATAPVHRGSPPAEPRRDVDTRTLLFVTAMVLFGIPVALAAALLCVYVLLFVLHGIGLLF